MRGVVAVALLCAACHGRARVEPPVRTPGEGVTISIYQDADRRYAVVDDRRWVDVVGGAVEIDEVPPDVALASLVIEPLAGAALEVGACRRLASLGPGGAAAAQLEEDGAGQAQLVAATGDPGRTFRSAQLTCAVRGAGRRHLIRIHYVAPSLGYRALHEVSMTQADRAELSSRFAIVAPRWRRAGVRAELALYAGLPGGPRAPIVLARGAISLDGSTQLVISAPRSLPARLVRVFGGDARSDDADPRDPSWRGDAHHEVRVWLELELGTSSVAEGPVHVHLEVPDEGRRELDLQATDRVSSGGQLRLPLWIDPTLHGIRLRVVDGDAATGTLIDRLRISVSSSASLPRVVWVEEALRPARRRTIRAARPARPQVTGDLARTLLELAPGATARTSYVVESGF